MRFLFCVIAMLLLITIAISFLACGDEGIVSQTLPDAVPIAYANVMSNDEYDCPIEDLGNWTLLTTLQRDNFSLGRFRVPDEEINPVNQAYVDSKDFLFIIYKAAVRIPEWMGRGDRTDGNVQQARYYLEAPGLLSQNAFITHWQVFHFIDPDAFWFEHWDTWRDKTESGFTIEFDSTPISKQLTPGTVKPREFAFSPAFGTSLDAWIVDGPGAPDIKEDFVLDIYTR